MDTGPTRREPNQAGLPHPTGHEQIQESDNKIIELGVSQCDSMSNVFFAYATPMQDEDKPSDGLSVNPVPQVSLNEPATWLSQSERWDGVIGYYQVVKEEEGKYFLEIGEVHEQSGDQESVPMVPDSFANLDLTRLTVWGWLLLLVTPFAIILPAIGLGNPLGVEQLPHSLHMPAAMLGLPLWGVLFLLGRVALESRNLTVVRRKKTGKDQS